MKVKYFSWVRDRIGIAEETVEPPASVRTVNDLIGWLSARGDTYAYAFEAPKGIRAAIDHTHVKREAMMPGPAAIAFFPPMPAGWPRERRRHHPYPAGRF